MPLIEASPRLRRDAPQGDSDGDAFTPSSEAGDAFHGAYMFRGISSKA